MFTGRYIECGNADSCEPGIDHESAIKRRDLFRKQRELHCYCEQY